jgi:hypothetical protein
MTDGTRTLATTLLTPIIAMATLSIVNLVAGQPVDPLIVLVFGAGFGLLYGLLAGLVLSYDLSKHRGVLALINDMTWSLPNTLVGFFLANPVYIFFGRPTQRFSKDEGWIAYEPWPSRTSGLGINVLQTVGTINIGGAGNHERVHLLQARIFGPLFIPIVIVNYILTGLLQILFTVTIGAILKAAGKRQTAHLEPPNTSAVKGFFGWIYYATVFELWAYATEPKHP